MDPAKISTGITAHQLLTYANGGKYWDDGLKKITWTEQPASGSGRLAAPVREGAGRQVRERGHRRRSEECAPARRVGAPEVPDLRQRLLVLLPDSEVPGRQVRQPTTSRRTPRTPTRRARRRPPAAGCSRSGRRPRIRKRPGSGSSSPRPRRTPVPSSRSRTGRRRPSPATRTRSWRKITRSGRSSRPNLQNNISVPTTSVEPQFEQIEYDMQDAILFERMPTKEALDSTAQKAQALARRLELEAQELS